MHGTGNDYVYIDLFKNKVDDPVTLAQTLSHRHFGVGSDGLILIKPFPGAHGEMEMYNADGSRSEMCGNGIRCVAKYLFDTYYPDQRELSIQTGRGLLKASIVQVKEGKAELIQINMGAPFFAPQDIPVLLPPQDKDENRILLNQSLSVADQTFTFHTVGMGNPHCVIFVDDVHAFPVEKYGPLIENHALFPKRVNVEFVQINGTELIQRTWERGSGETWACGTGASAVSVVAISLGLVTSPVKINLLGGTLELAYHENGPVYMTGPAVEVFRGTWNSFD